jgi:hypothetical protein
MAHMEGERDQISEFAFCISFFFFFFLAEGLDSMTRHSHSVCIRVRMSGMCVTVSAPFPFPSKVVEGCRRDFYQDAFLVLAVDKCKIVF